MSVHVFSNWNVRITETQEEVQPYRRYYFLCEGANTERFYFRKLISLKKALGIHPFIDVCYLNKEDVDKNISNPGKLYELALKTHEELVQEEKFDQQRDRMILVFDADVYEHREDAYKALLEGIEDNQFLVGVSNPNFELFLILHYADAYEKYIRGHEREFMTPTYTGSFKHAQIVLHELTGMNAKTNKRIGELAVNVKNAINEEKHINENIHLVQGQVSCSVGLVIEQILNDNPKP